MTGNSRSIQIVALSAIGALILMLCAVVAVVIDRNRDRLAKVFTRDPPSAPAPWLTEVPTPLPTSSPAPVMSADPVLANRKVRPIDLQAYFGDPGNYPEDARARGEQGGVAAKLTVEATGRVSACEVVVSSGSRSLDDATCRLALRATRFEPARNGLGEPIPSTFTLRVRWQLPDG